MPNMLDLDTRFSQQPQANIERSIIPRKSDVKTTFDFGKIIPIYLDEVLPGQSSKMSIGSLVRMSTPKYPVMDTAYLDLYAFFVPNRLVWNHWEEFMGENKESAWVSGEEYSIPSLEFDDFSVSSGSIYDYYGLPIGHYNDDYFVSALPFRGYNLIWNEWFRDQNYQSPVNLNIGDSDAYSYRLLNANKLHDLFTSVTPEPQKGASATLLFNGGKAPVLTGADMSNDDYIAAWEQMHNKDWAQATDAEKSTQFAMVTNGTYGLSVSNGQLYTDTTSPAINNGSAPVFSNLYADLSAATISTINQLRSAIVVQQYLETLARSGSRYTEIIRSLFGVISPDARLQRPELLGHIRMDINMQQVIQTSFDVSSLTGGMPSADYGVLGSTGGMSKTTNYGFLYEKSFVEHGYIHIFAVARTELSYQQGIEKHFKRKAVTDFYNPLFANIGNQPIPYYMIYATGNEAEDNQVFGYNEAWAEYRFKPNRVAGSFRSNSGTPLDAWHYAQWFNSRPFGSDFLEADASIVSRTLTYDGKNEQLLCNFYFDEVATLPMPVYSIPGLDVL